MRRERKGNIIFAVLFCVAVLAFFVLMNISEIMDYSKIEAAGKKSLLPVDIKQETRKRRYKGRTTQTTKNYVKFVVEINNKKRHSGCRQAMLMARIHHQQELLLFLVKRRLTGTYFIRKTIFIIQRMRQLLMNI